MNTPGINKLRKIVPLLGLGGLLLFVSCKKDGTEPDEPITSPTTGTRMEFTLDSILLYAQQIYLWREAMPTYSDFSPRTRYSSISPEISAFRQELFDLSQLKLRNNGLPYEQSTIANTPKYSFLEQSTETSSAPVALVDVSNYVQQTNFWEQDNKKIAYLYINSFPELSGIKDRLDEAVHSMANQATQYLIVDLRHHGGGYVHTAEYLANLLAPSSLQGKTMYSEQFNDLMQQGKASLLKRQLYRDANGNTVQYNGRLATLADVDYSLSANTHYFDKQGPLHSVQSIYFLVSERTASAAEMLISVLKPYFDVKLIGNKTYGKPVGTFAIQIDKYQIYLSSFVIQNANGWSDYFDGIEVDIAATGSNIPDLGNPEETLLAAALKDIGVTNKANKSGSSISIQQRNNLIINPALIKDQFKLKNE